jgi:23S rRNA (uridine2552-2'-O)-methyltransferase
MPRDLHDHYFRQAKREGYLSRAAYKLIEIADRRKLLRRGQRVLDCGAAPGSWLQVAAQRVGPSGIVVGIDLEPIRHRLPDNVRVLLGDLHRTDAAALLAPLAKAARPGRPAPRFDVVLSDMAPDTSGSRSTDHHQSVRLCDAVLSRCPRLLGPGGALVMKVLEGEAYPDLLARTGELFERVKGFRPRASRRESTEMFIIATGFRGQATAAGPALPDP